MSPLCHGFFGGVERRLPLQKNSGSCPGLASSPCLSHHLRFDIGFALTRAPVRGLRRALTEERPCRGCQDDRRAFAPGRMAVVERVEGNRAQLHRADQPTIIKAGQVSLENPGQCSAEINKRGARTSLPPQDAMQRIGLRSSPVETAGSAKWVGVNASAAH